AWRAASSRSSLRAKLVGRGTIQRRLDGGGVTGAAPSTPPPCCAWFPSPSLCDGEERQSPHVHPLLRRQVQLVAGLDVERLVPGVEIADDAVDAILGRAVLVGQQLGAERAFALLGLPAVAVGDEEALVAGQAVDDRRLAVLGDIFAVRRISDFEPAEVAEIL